ncbi:MAG: DMT family transporter [Nitrospinota bacterium]|nr:MAG: DMT family transporter [Nitrospinota bacterium]
MVVHARSVPPMRHQTPDITCRTRSTPHITRENSMGLSAIALYLRFSRWWQQERALARQKSGEKGAFSLFDLAVLCSTLIQGMNNIVTKLILLHFHPWVFLVFRNTLGVVIGWILLWQQERQLRPLFRAWKPFFLPGVMGRGLSSICWSLGLLYTSASNAALISCSTPVFTILYMALTGQEAMAGRGWLGIGLSIGGIYLVVTQGQGLRISSADVYGGLLVLAGSVAWSYYLIMVKKRIGEKYSVPQVTIFSLTTGLTLLLPVGASQFPHQSWSAIPPITWSLVVYTAAGNMILASLLWTWGVAGMGLNRTVIYQYLTPVIAVIGAWMVLGEPITVPKILGGMLVLGGIYLAKRR